MWSGLSPPGFWPHCLPRTPVSKCDPRWPCKASLGRGAGGSRLGPRLAASQVRCCFPLEALTPPGGELLRLTRPQSHQWPIIPIFLQEPAAQLGSRCRQPKGPEKSGAPRWGLAPQSSIPSGHAGPSAGTPMAGSCGVLHAIAQRVLCAEPRRPGGQGEASLKLGGRSQGAQRGLGVLWEVQPWRLLRQQGRARG